MNVLNWQNGYIVNATTVWKYIATYVIHKYTYNVLFYYLKVPTDNDPTTVRISTQ